MNIQELKKNMKINELSSLIKGYNIKIMFLNILTISNKMNYRENTITRNPPKECLIYETMVNLNNHFNRLEKEIKDKSVNIMKRIEIMKNKLNSVKNQNIIDLSDCKYSGEIKDNKIEGLGIAEYNDGNKYEGEFKDYQEHGLGIFYLFNSFIYIGEFKEGNKNEFGIEKIQMIII